MADELPDGDEPLGRNEAFFAVLGLARAFYMQAIEASITHAQARHAAAPDPDLVPWVGLGARNIGGRVRALAQNPQRPQVWYAGLAQGGVFKSGDGGDTWGPIGGQADAFPVGALAVAPSSPNIVYVGSGEMGITHGTGGALAANEKFAAGRGFFRYDEAAAPPTMVREVLPLVTAPAATAGAANCFARIVVDPKDPQRCWIASHTGLWRREAGPVFHNENPTQAGVAPVAPNVGACVSDVIVVPHWNAQRPRTYRVFAAVAAVGIYRGVFDLDNAAAGTQWEPLLADPNLPVASAPGAVTWDRIGLAFCAGQPQHVYAIAEDPANDVVLGVWHSDNGGDSWVARPAPNLGGQVWVNLYVAVHPDNPALIVAGAVDLARSRDHGANWEPLIDWRNFNAGDRAQHGDQHAAVFDAADPRRLWVSNDGGIAMAADVVQANPRTSGGWRKRSHGLVGAQFNDIATHPNYPFMLGGGLQDNGAYISFGGETWNLILDGDGGQMAFEVHNPRTYFAPNQARNAMSRVVAPNSITGVGGVGLVLRQVGNADLVPPNDVLAFGRLSPETAAMTATRPLFVPLIEHHRGVAGHLIVGRGFRAAPATTADIFVTTNAMATIAPGGLPSLQVGGVPVIGNGSVSAIAYGNGANAAAVAIDWWVGTTNGLLLRRPNSGANPNTWINVALPGVAAGLQVTRIAVHPADERYIAVSLADTAPPHQGRVLLTLDLGANWAEITGLAAVGAPPGAAPPLLNLPPSPVTCLVFDPQPAAAAAQVLFAGTLGGVYVIRNLPRRRVPAAAGAVPAFNPRWTAYNGLVSGPAPAGLLPLTLVKDLRIATLPRDAGAAATEPESIIRHRLIAAMYGRGMLVCDITRGYPAAIGAGGPAHRLYIRQTVIEDGLHYPRPTPTTLNTAPAAGGAQPKLGGDPRAPVGTVQFSDREAYNIRVDNAPFQFFEDSIDGVEFDEDLRQKNLRPGEPNRIYVQVHTRGHRRAAVVDVDLFFAPAPAPGAANAAPLPDLQADFWAVWQQNVLPAPAAPLGPQAAAWQRVGGRATAFRVAPNQPEVIRFDWNPPLALAGRHVALLAVVSGLFDPMPANPPTVMANLIRNERRAALRVVRADAFTPELFIRDGLDDDGRLGGVAFGGRSPDIVVVPAAPADPADAFKDLGDDRVADRVQGNAGANVVYVRVHNRKAADTAVDVELFWALPNLPVSVAPGRPGPPFNAANWQVIAPVNAVNLTVPAGGTALARFDFSAAPAPVADFPNAIAFIALIKSHDGLDPEPVRTEVDTQPEFWRLFLARANSNNAALRALRYA